MSRHERINACLAGAINRRAWVRPWRYSASAPNAATSDAGEVSRPRKSLPTMGDVAILG